jgi:hypothetical protein
MQERHRRQAERLNAPGRRDIEISDGPDDVQHVLG